MSDTAVVSPEKEVDFATYCPICKFWGVDVDDDPCTFCLDEAVNVESRKPVRFKEEEGL